MSIGIVSGYFNPLHLGHIKMFDKVMDDCRSIVVIVNNDEQQLLKKGKIIMNVTERALLLSRIKGVEQIIFSIDRDGTVCKTLDYLGQLYKDSKVTFYNGGDRKNKKKVPEYEVCKKHGIQMVFDAGGNEKITSSSDINKRRGLE